MAYRFVLDVPAVAHEDLKTVVGSVRDARVLIDRPPRSADVEGARGELTVTAYSLDIINTLYGWMREKPDNADVTLEAHRGERLKLAEHDARELRRIVQSDQYWLENTVPHIHYVDSSLMESGARVAEVPYGGRLAGNTVVAAAEQRVQLGDVDHIAVRVRDLAGAERFYQEFFGMDVVYRARREADRWEHFDAAFDWVEALQRGEMPEIVRLENGPVALVLIGAGAGAVMHENRVAYVSLSVPLQTLNDLRGRALFASYTVQEDSSRAFRFVDPFGVTWQLVAAQ
jgi:catechol 2,3-dioxygenase-like lactoylglutathione lyase family enzyme